MVVEAFALLEIAHDRANVLARPSGVGLPADTAPGIPVGIPTLQGKYLRDGS